MENTPETAENGSYILTGRSFTKMQKKGSNMKQRTLKRLLSAVLMTAMLCTALPANLTAAKEAEKAFPADNTLQELGIIDAAGEEDTTKDLPDQNKHASARPYTASKGDMVIAIDPGHGGSDSGASYGGIQEKDINLTIAKYIQTYLSNYEDVQVYLTRSTDKYLELSERVNHAVAKGADVFISIHNNASTNANTSGSMVFYPNSSYRPDLGEEGSELSQSILNQLTGLGLPDLGIRIRNSESGNKYDDGSIADYYGVIRNAKLSGIAGIIVEHAFLSNDYDRNNYLSTDARLKQLALADVKGIADYYGLVYNGLTEPAVTFSSPDYKSLQIEWEEQEQAKGYLVYRSEKKAGTYTRLAKITGSENTVYIDQNIEQGKMYYYKVRAYNSTAGTTFFSDYSRIVGGYTIGGTELAGIKQMAGGYLKINWQPYAEADGYAIYRSEEGGAYKRIATVDKTKTAYNDKSVEPGTNYQYKVRTINTIYGNEGFGKSSSGVPVTFIETPEMKRLDIRDDGTIKVVWQKALGASKYVVQRSTTEDGDYTTVATITNDAQNYYVDRSAERGFTYYYRVNAYNQNGKVTGSTGYVESISAQNFRTPELTSARITKSRPGMYLAWTQVPGASGYRLYRSTKENSGYTKIITLKGEDILEYIDTTETTAGTTYYYKVKAYVYNSAGTSWSEASEARSVIAGYGIMGKSNTTPEKMVAFFEKRGGVYPEDIYWEYDAPTLEDFCQIVYEEAQAEGVKAEVVFGQVCKETGFLRFGGDVEPEQCNFAGIGATGGGAKGASFPDVRTGIRAQVQHLKAYASDEPLNQECVDPRFQYVKRGTALYVEWLGIQENPLGVGWATGKNYGYSLRDDYIKPLLGM